MDEESETLNELTCRKQVVTAVSQIRNSLRENKLLLQHNIEYGFLEIFRREFNCYCLFNSDSNLW